MTWKTGQVFAPKSQASKSEGPLKPLDHQQGIAVGEGGVATVTGQNSQLLPLLPSPTSCLQACRRAGPSPLPPSLQGRPWGLFWQEWEEVRLLSGLVT